MWLGFLFDACTDTLRLQVREEDVKGVNVTAQRQTPIQDELDTTPEVTARLREAYSHMISLEDLKPRILSQQVGELHNKFYEIFSTDMNFDLDLPVRENNDDVSRDKLRVKFRYLREDSPPMICLKGLVVECCFRRELLPRHYLERAAQSLADWFPPGGSQRLLVDVGGCLKALAGVQDLRTVLTFMLMVICNETTYPHWVAGVLLSLLSTYCTVVLLDDAVSNSGVRSHAFAASKLLPETRQYFCKRPA
eukprot:s183_g4.t1